jgi:hypothetical protein
VDDGPSGFGYSPVVGFLKVDTVSEEGPVIQEASMDEPLYGPGPEGLPGCRDVHRILSDMNVATCLPRPFSRDEVEGFISDGEAGVNAENTPDSRMVLSFPEETEVFFDSVQCSFVTIPVRDLIAQSTGEPGDLQSLRDPIQTSLDMARGSVMVEDGGATPPYTLGS